MLLLSSECSGSQHCWNFKQNINNLMCMFSLTAPLIAPIRVYVLALSFTAETINLLQMVTDNSNLRKNLPLKFYG